MWDASRGDEFAERGSRRCELAWDYYEQSQQADGDSQRDYLRRALDLAPSSPEYHLLRGDAFARLGEYDNAAREFAAATAEPVDNGLWMARRQALALLGARDLDAYRKIYASMLEAVHDSEVWSKRLYVAWLGTLVPSTTNEFESDVQGWLNELAEFTQQEEALEQTILQDYDRLVFAAMLYRKEDFVEAERVLTTLVESLGEAATSEGERVRVCAYFFLAMTRQQMGHQFQARRLLAEADRREQQFEERQAPWYWKVEFDTLRREAKKLTDL